MVSRASGSFFVRISMAGLLSCSYALLCTMLVDAQSIFSIFSSHVTCNQEDEILLCRTLYGVMKNIAHLVSASDMPHLSDIINLIPVSVRVGRPRHGVQILGRKWLSAYVPTGAKSCIPVCSMYSLRLEFIKMVDI
jgi:hypothetical protein